MRKSSIALALIGFIICGWYLTTSTVVRAQENVPAESFTSSSISAIPNSTTSATTVNLDERVIEGIVQSKLRLPCQNTIDQTTCNFVQILLLDGREINVQITDDLNSNQILVRDWKVKDRVIVVESKKIDGTSDFYIRNPDRQAQLWIFLFFICVLAFIIARFRGLMALGALTLSTVVIFALFIPQVLNGGNTIFWGLICSFLILAINQLVGHGLSRISFIGLGSGLLTMVLAWGIGSWSVNFFRITGGGDADVVFVRDFALNVKNIQLDFQGLFLAGVMIGAAGAIDDVVAAQTSTITELVNSNRSLRFSELYIRSMRVGKAHIVSMINTLFLAYAGASLPLLVLFATNTNETLFQLLSREDLTEEIIRTGVGSIALLLVVPLSTVCAALYYKRPSWLENYFPRRS